MEYLDYDYLDETDREILSMEEWETWTVVDDCVHIPGTDIYLPIDNYMDIDEAVASAVYIAYKEKNGTV